MILNPSTQQMFVWIVIGAVAGMITSMMFYRKPEPVIDLRSLGLGILGALVGRIIFDLLRVQIGLPAITIRGDDLLAAIIGSAILLVLIRVLRQ